MNEERLITDFTVYICIWKIDLVTICAKTWNCILCPPRRMRRTRCWTSKSFANYTIIFQYMSHVTAKVKLFLCFHALRSHLVNLVHILNIDVINRRGFRFSIYRESHFMSIVFLFRIIIICKWILCVWSSLNCWISSIFHSIKEVEMGFCCTYTLTTKTMCLTQFRYAFTESLLIVHIINDIL